jgi:hypothetical protein
MTDEPIQTEEQLIFHENIQEALVHTRQALHLARRLWPEPGIDMLPVSDWNAASNAEASLQAAVVHLRQLTQVGEEE